MDNRVKSTAAASNGPRVSHVSKCPHRGQHAQGRQARLEARSVESARPQADLFQGRQTYGQNKTDEGRGGAWDSDTLQHRYTMHTGKHLSVAIVG